MSNVYFISDLHFNHANVLGFEPMLREGRNMAEHDALLIEKWNSLINKKDLVYVLGDVVMGKDGDLAVLNKLTGRKVLIRGNHDDRHTTAEYLEYFEEVYGILKYKGAWLTHCPIHPTELRGRINIHGHIHGSAIRDHYHLPDTRYINVCVEACNGYPVRATDIFEQNYEPRVW